MIHEPTVILKPEMVRIAETARIDSFCKIEGGMGVIIGEYVHIASFCHINPGGGWVELQDHCGLASGVKVIGGRPDLGYLHICPTYENPDLIHAIRLTTVIQRYAVAFSGAVILPGITVGFGAVIAAGAVVVSDVPNWAIMAGVPAKQIGVRKLWDGQEAQLEDPIAYQFHQMFQITHAEEEWVAK